MISCCFDYLLIDLLFWLCTQVSSATRSSRDWEEMASQIIKVSWTSWTRHPFSIHGCRCSLQLGGRGEVYIYVIEIYRRRVVVQTTLQWRINLYMPCKILPDFSWKIFGHMQCRRGRIACCHVCSLADDREHRFCTTTSKERLGLHLQHRYRQMIDDGAHH